MQTYVFIRVYSEGIIKNIEIQISCLKPNLPLHNNIVAAVRVFVSTKNGNIASEMIHHSISYY